MVSAGVHGEKAALLGLQGVLAQFAKMGEPWQTVYFKEAVQLEISGAGAVTKREVGTEGPKALEASLELKEVSVEEDAMAYARFNASSLTVCLCLLKVNEAWRVIAEMRSPAAEVETAFNCTDFIGVCGGATKYVTTNRAGSAEGMAGVFDEVSRLSFSTGDDLRVVSRQDFCQMVAGRWNNPIHAPYAHLKDDPRLPAHDSINSIQFVGPATAVVKLAVAFPPVLYTDLLFFALLPTGTSGARTWRIVAKSSVSVPFLADEAASDAAPF
ncbi:hypothetical protein CTAYLR_009014 [Chrysophaeum taylorii]|uniref:Uncharacterized protein n=1 Tax=Chrysophaeum taylorii TaxID=2483200 RepID=A0AAD7XT89_9STRA|nr:hypothetical protein CTAYLR_009014 [Chrysophaeum taylorii]